MVKSKNLELKILTFKLMKFTLGGKEHLEQSVCTLIEGPFTRKSNPIMNAIIMHRIDTRHVKP